MMAALAVPVIKLAETGLKVVLGTLAILFAYNILLIVYNLWFHPLRKIPGPLLARVSRLWARIGNFYGRKSERIHAAHLRYGM